MICYDNIDQEKAEIPLISDTVPSQQNTVPGVKRSCHNDNGGGREGGRKSSGCFCA